MVRPLVVRPLMVRPRARAALFGLPPALFAFLALLFFLDCQLGELKHDIDSRAHLDLFAVESRWPVAPLPDRFHRAGPEQFMSLQHVQ